MRSILVCVLLILASTQAHKKHGSTSSSSDKNEVEVSRPTTCALYRYTDIEAVMEDFSSSSSQSDDSESGTVFYDPGQFIPNGGIFEQGSSVYYFSFCTDTPQPSAIEYCSSDASVCSVSSKQIGTTLATFSEMSYAPKDNYEAGLTITYTHPVATCPNGTAVYSFVLNCSKYFDPETNYTITSTEFDSNGCGATIEINTVAGCPIKAERKPVTSHRPKFTRFFLMGFAVLGGVIFLCSCCLAMCLCCKNRREKCAAKRGACAKPQKPILPQQRPAPVAAPRPAPVAAPRPPVTPPPPQPQQQQQQQPQLPQMPGYFVPVPQGMAPMYPNLYQGGYLPLVPMMAQQPAIHQQANPFVALSDNQVEQRENQIAEDERLARLLQQQFNQA